MQIARRLLGLSMACLIYSALAWPLSGFAGEGELASLGTSGQSALQVGENVFAVPGVQVLDDSQQLTDEMIANRVNPQAVAARAHSRTAYRRLSDTAAVRAARETLPTVSAPASSGLSRMPVGAKVNRYLNAHIAQLTFPNGRHALVDSVAPIARSSKPGDFQPLDLNLRRSVSGFTPARPAVGVSIPISLQAGIRLGSESISLTPLGQTGASLRARGGLDGSSVFYANAQTDTDVAAKPTSTGFETYDVLRSIQSPQHLAYRLSLPKGAKLLPIPHGSGSSQIVVAGHVVALIPAPTAEDADGTTVPTSTTIVGDTLAVSVPHTHGDYRYPIIVDPTVIDSDFLEVTKNWHFEHSGTHFATELKGGIGAEYWYLSVDASHLLNEWGAWLYQTQGESHIYAVSTEAAGSQSASNMEALLGIFNTGGWEASTAFPSSFIRTAATVCISGGSCLSSAGTAANLAAFWVTAKGTGTAANYSLYTTSVYIAQTNGPSIVPNTTTEKFGASYNVLYGTEHWLSKQAYAEFNESDPGVGVYETTFTGPEAKKWSRGSRLWCAGPVQCPQTRSEILSYAESGVEHLPDGEPVVEVKVTNAMGASATTSVKVRVDGTAPHELALSGLPEGGNVGDRAVKLVGKATDGSGTTPSSGVASMSLKVDGVAVAGNPASCSPGPCTATAEWTINAEEYSGGKHTLLLTATDKAGNIATTEVTMTVHHAAPVDVGPGTLNPVTGEFDLESTDVSIPTSGTPLTVVRNYNSRDPEGGSEGPFGSPWNVSFGGAQKLVRSASGNINLVDATGRASTFIHKADGSYTSPVGDANLVLKETWIENSFTLTDNGSALTFTSIEGDPGNVWRPTRATGTGDINATTFSYQDIEGVVEPLEALGPVPAGVSCQPELKAGCRALTFNYAASTTATGEGAGEWGDYVGRMTRSYFTGYDTVSKTMTTTAVAQFAYDTKGRLRAEWDPRVSPALKTTYGYDPQGHVTSLSAPGREPWILQYGTTSLDTTSGRLVAVGRPVATTALGTGNLPTNIEAPWPSWSRPVINKVITTSAGTWSNSPLHYGYQWERCNSSGGSCVPIGGAINAAYTPTVSDLGSRLVARVTATNAAGSRTAATPVSAIVGYAAELQQLSAFGSSGAGNGQIKYAWGIAHDSKGNVWVADTVNNRIEEFNSEGAFVRVAGTGGSGALLIPEDVAVDAAGDAWVADTGKSRIVEFNSFGEYVRAFGTAGSGTGQFNSPWGITVDSGNHVWVVDAGNNRVQEFTSEGSFIRTFGSAGAGNGQFNSPGEVAVDSKGDVWVADTGNNRIQEFTAEGVYIKKFGSAGSENGQFCEPWRLGIDPNNDQVWVVDGCNNRVQVFSQAGSFLQKFGTTGSGSGQFSGPDGIAFSQSGYVFILDRENSRIVKWSDGAPQPVSEFGAFGTGNGQLKNPWGIARDSGGDIWVADAGNNRIEEFDAEGKYLRSAGTSGSGLLSAPEDVTVDASGNVWVADTGKSRIVEFNATGEYLRSSGTAGSGNGQFKSPLGIAVDKAGNVWVADSGNNRIQELTGEGAFVRAVGSVGSGNGQFQGPGEVSFDSKGDVWVADTGNSRVEEFSGEGTYMRKFGAHGEGQSQFCNPWRLAIDANDRIWVADSCNNRVQVFEPEGTFVGTFGSSGTGMGQFNSPAGIAFSPSGYVYVLDKSNSRVEKWSGSSYWEGTAGATTALPAFAPYTIEYGVKAFGPGSPYSLSASSAAKWGQTDVPVEATAIFPPDEPMGWPASDYKRATIDYLDTSSQLVNVASPGGSISTAEYNSYNDVTRVLTPDNRETALKEGTKSAEVSQTLDTQSTYGEEGAELLSRLGPLHTVKLASGATVQARIHTAYSYDEGAPAGGPYRLVTKVTQGAQIAGEPEADIRTNTTSYAGQNDLGWVLRKPTATRTDPSGLKLTHTTVYDPASGHVVETRTPAAGAPNEEVLSGYVHKSTFGGAGLANPAAIARDGEGNIWVADTEYNQVDEYSSGGTFLRAFGTTGSGNGQLSKPEGIAVDGKNRVWVADTGNNRIEQFTTGGVYVSAFGSMGTGWKQFKGPSGVVVSSAPRENLFVADTGNNRIEEYSATGEEDKEYGSAGTGNGQFAKPEGLALDSKANLWVADTGNNRVQEIHTQEKILEPWEYLRQFGTLGSGNGQLSKPEGIAVGSEGNVFVVDGGNNRVQEFSSTGSYVLQFGTAGSGETNMKAPSGVVIDTSEDAYVLDTGNNRIQEWLPAGSVHEANGTGGSHGTQTIYYTAATEPLAYACGEHPEWAGMPCETKLATQPKTSGIPDLPVTVVTYNIWDEPVTSTETVGATTRTTTITYDGAGRTLTEAVSSTVGTTLPVVEAGYDSASGALTRLSTSAEGSTKTVEGAFNKLGQMEWYKDADGNTSSFTYDIDGRLEYENDGKGTQKYTYNATTGFLSQLVDSNVGIFSATYDADGNIATLGYPNGMTVTNVRNAEGDRTGVEYIKNTYCTSGCTWYSDSVVPSIHGQVLSRMSTFSSQEYAYDAAGRLTKTLDTPTGSGCTTHIYALDEETNVTSFTTRPPGSGGICASEGGTAENHAYDSANRLNDSGIAYSTFGDITKLPAVDAGGSELTSSYYADGTLASQTQTGETIGYSLDPLGRPRQTVSTGTTNSTVTSHYSQEGNGPAWTEDTTGKWVRYIRGIDGNLVATQANGEPAVLQVENLHGDIVATASLSETATGLLSSNDTTEYGVPRTGSPPKYSWLGGLQLATELPSGVIAMGARSYVPWIGRFLQPDPVEGGSANAYSYTFGDPVNSADPSGEYTVAIPSWVHAFFDEQAVIVTEEAIERAAEEQADKEEAEAKAQEALEEAWAATSGDSWEGAGGYGGRQYGKGGKAAEPTKVAKLQKSYSSLKIKDEAIPLKADPGGDCDRECRKFEKGAKKAIKEGKDIKAGTKSALEAIEKSAAEAIVEKGISK